MITVYGIKNCDTCRKALKWLTEVGLEHRFHDLRSDGLSAPVLSGWVNEAGWERLLNRRGTTWRKLPETERDGIDGASAEALMLAHPTLIKRPVFDVDNHIHVGFTDDQRTALNP